MPSRVGDFASDVTARGTGHFLSRATYRITTFLKMTFACLISLRHNSPMLHPGTLMRLSHISLKIGMTAGLALLAGGGANAQAVADCDRGKTGAMLIGYTSGGGYDICARVLSKHLGRRSPGNPSVVPQHMPGAGSLRTANFFFNAEPRA